MNNGALVKGVPRALRLVLYPLTVCAILAWAQDMPDVRVVNGRDVDLGPVHKWLADHQGARPLKHWKQIRVLEVIETAGGSDRCQIKNESGKTLELWMINLPASVKTTLQQLQQQHAQILRMRTAIEADTRKIRIAEGQIPIAAADDPAWVRSITSQHGQLDIWKANVTTAQEELAKLEAKYAIDLAHSGEKLTVLAMFSGRKYASLEVWDCGRPRST